MEKDNLSNVVIRHVDYNALLSGPEENTEPGLQVTQHYGIGPQQPEREFTDRLFYDFTMQYLNKVLDRITAIWECNPGIFTDEVCRIPDCAGAAQKYTSGYDATVVAIHCRTI